MRLAIELSRQNVLQGTGGPFGAAIFEANSNRLVSVGVNSVERLSNSLLHAEVMALMLAEASVQSFSLGCNEKTSHELVTSCAPCAMCLGAIHWSGVRKVSCGASGKDARDNGFDEGPVFPESYQYLQQRGLTLVTGVLRDDARAVLELYRQRDGNVYNG